MLSTSVANTIVTTSSAFQRCRYRFMDAVVFLAIYLSLLCFGVKVGKGDAEEQNLH